MKKKPASLIKQGKKKMGRPKIGDDVKGKLTLSIDRETITAAKGLPGSLSARVETFLNREILKQEGKG